MDIFCEYMVKKIKTGKEIMQTAAIILAAVILSAAVVLFLLGRLFGFEIFIVAAIWYGAVYLIRKNDIEFEYILTNSILDIDKIMSKKSRKRVISVDFKNIEGCAPVGAPAQNSGAKVFDCTGNAADGGVYCIEFFKDSQKYCVYFQPNAKMLKNIKTANPRLVTVNEGDLQ